MMLSKINKHSRDINIVFDEPTHVYSVNNIPYKTSVTKFIHSFFDKFEPDVVLKKMVKSRSSPTSKYYNKTDDEIKNMLHLITDKLV